MKILLVWAFILALLCGVNADARLTAGIIAAGSGSMGEPATDYFNEGFEAAGYDETASTGIGSDWYESAGGGTSDEDYSVSTAESVTGLSLASTWGTQCKRLAGGTTMNYIKQTLDDTHAELWIRFDVIFRDVSALAASASMIFFAVSSDTNGSNVAGYARLYNSAGSVKMYGQIVGGTTTYCPPSPYYSFGTNTKYRMDFHFVGSGTCEWKIDGVSQGTGTTTQSVVQYLFFHRGGTTGNETTEVLFDNIQISTTGWLP